MLTKRPDELGERYMRQSLRFAGTPLSDAHMHYRRRVIHESVSPFGYNRIQRQKCVDRDSKRSVGRLQSEGVQRFPRLLDAIATQLVLVLRSAMQDLKASVTRRHRDDGEGGAQDVAQFQMRASVLGNLDDGESAVFPRPQQQIPLGPCHRRERSEEVGEDCGQRAGETWPAQSRRHALTLLVAHDLAIKARLSAAEGSLTVRFAHLITVATGDDVPVADILVSLPRLSPYKQSPHTAHRVVVDPNQPAIIR